MNRRDPKIEDEALLWAMDWWDRQTRRRVPVTNDEWEAEFDRWDTADQLFGKDLARRLCTQLRLNGEDLWRRSEDPRVQAAMAPPVRTGSAESTGPAAPVPARQPATEPVGVDEESLGYSDVFDGEDSTDDALPEEVAGAFDELDHLVAELDEIEADINEQAAERVLEQQALAGAVDLTQLVAITAPGDTGDVDAPVDAAEDLADDTDTDSDSIQSSGMGHEADDVDSDLLESVSESGSDSAEPPFIDLVARESGNGDKPDAVPSASAERPDLFPSKDLEDPAQHRSDDSGESEVADDGDLQCQAADQERVESKPTDINQAADGSADTDGPEVRAAAARTTNATARTTTNAATRTTTTARTTTTTSVVAAGDEVCELPAAAERAPSYPPAVDEALTLLAAIGTELAAAREGSAKAKPSGEIADQLRYFVDASRETSAAGHSSADILPATSVLGQHIPELAASVATPTVLPQVSAPIEVETEATGDSGQSRRGTLLILCGLTCLAMAAAGGWIYQQRSTASVETVTTDQFPEGSSLAFVETDEPLESTTDPANLAEPEAHVGPDVGSEGVESVSGAEAVAPEVDLVPEIAEFPSAQVELSELPDPAGEAIWDAAPVVTFTRCRDSVALGYLTNTYEQTAVFDILINFSNTPGAILPASLNVTVDPGLTAEVSAPFGAVIEAGIPVQCTGTVRAVTFVNDSGEPVTPTSNDVSAVAGAELEPDALVEELPGEGEAQDVGAASDVDVATESNPVGDAPGEEEGATTRQ